MLGSHPSRWIIFLVSGSLTALGCVGTTDTGPQGETGSLSVDLVLADGLEIDEVGWQITGNGMDMSGDVDVSAPRSTASVEVFGLPPGETDYTVTLTATTTDEQVSCQGSAPFNVEVGQTTDVMVMLNCKKPRTLGGVRVNGKFNICTQLTKAVVSPLQTSVGNDISLAAQAFDEEGDPIHYIWTGDGGSIADPSAASTTYTCQEVGDHTVTIMVTDNDVYCRMATWTIPVTCVEGDGGDLCEDVMCEDDGNECTETACNPANGACETSNVADGTECDGGDGTCSGGQCVELDLCEGVDCNDSNECTADACNPADGTCSSTNVDDGTPCNNDEGVCSGGSCVDVDLCDGVVCDDTGNECTVAMCNNTTGACDTMNMTDGTECNGGAGACSGGECIDNNLCQGVDCTSDNDCVQDGTCDPADGMCDLGDPQPADTACDLATTDDGFCDGAGACVECNADAQCPDDGNECTAEACTSNACSSSPVADGTMCDNDMGVCDQGTCVPANLCEGVDCSDDNECTQDLCDPATGQCSNPSEADGTECTCPVCGAEGLCMMGECVDPCDDVNCSDGNQCTADLCNVGVCSNPNVGPGAACDQDGGIVCDGAGTCVECNNDGQCAMGQTCTDNECVVDVVDPPAASASIPNACRVGGAGGEVLTALPIEITLDPTPIEAGESFDVTLVQAVAPVAKTFLQAAVNLIGTLEIAFINPGTQVTVGPAANATGPNNLVTTGYLYPTQVDFELESADGAPFPNTAGTYNCYRTERPGPPTQPDDTKVLSLACVGGNNAGSCCQPDDVVDPGEYALGCPSPSDCTDGGGTCEPALLLGTKPCGISCNPTTPTDCNVQGCGGGNAGNNFAGCDPDGPGDTDFASAPLVLAPSLASFVPDGSGQACDGGARLGLACTDAATDCDVCDGGVTPGAPCTIPGFNTAECSFGTCTIGHACVIVPEVQTFTVTGASGEICFETVGSIFTQETFINVGVGGGINAPIFCGPGVLENDDSVTPLTDADRLCFDIQ